MSLDLYFIGKIVPEQSVKLRKQGTKEWFEVKFTSNSHWRSFFLRWREADTNRVYFSPTSKRFYFDA